MNNKPSDIVLEQLRAIRAEQAETSAKIGTLAQAVVGLQRDSQDIKKELSTLSQNSGILAIAVDEHTHRLDRIEKRLGLVEA
jgi:hypothetical protein